MDVLRLNVPDYQADKIIEGYSSMVWTERYIVPGEFEMKTPYVAQTLKDLPEMTFISHQETREVMMVETHSIGKDSKGFPELTVKGRSIDAFSDQRFLEGPWPKKMYKMARNYTAAEAAAVVLWNIFVNPTVNDVTRAGPWSRSLRDSLPNVAVSDSSTIAGTRARRWLEPGQAYPQVVKFLQNNKLGIRGVRPNSGPSDLITVSTDDKGIITRTNQNFARLRFDIYNGVDRRARQESRPRVIFTYAQGHLDDPSYLFSVDPFKTNIFVISSVGSFRIFREGSDEGSLAGWMRRGQWVDGGEPELDESEPTATHTAAEIKAENAAVKAEFKEDLLEKGQTMLQKTGRIDMFEGKVSPLAPYRYNVHYGLGDLVTLQAEYDYFRSMRVSEYVRTHDKDGDRGYPGLVVTL